MQRGVSDLEELHSQMTDREVKPILPFQKTEEIYIEDIGDTHSPLYYRCIKRAFDFIVSLLVVIIAFIPGLIIAICIKLDSKGPVFYLQSRLGKNGKQFNIIKYRTMPLDAEEEGAKWSFENDERATKVGAFLRNSHLDELPQLLNILANHMSLIGPRPERKIFYDVFETYIHGFSERLKVKPGLTGYAQVYGGLWLKPEEKILYDMEYIKNRSLLLDIRIIFRTIKMFLTGDKKNKNERD